MDSLTNSTSSRFSLPIGKQREAGSGNGHGTPHALAKAQEVRAYWKRRAVLLLVAGATVGMVYTGGQWSLYRLQHTVVNDARVKGRVYRLGARLDGQVKAVEVEPGQRVFKGQVLIRLEDQHIAAAAREAQAAVKAAAKKLDVERLAIEQARRQFVLDIERADGGCAVSAGDLEAAMSLREKWEHEYNRIAELIKAGTASASDLDNAMAQRDNARALVKAALGRQSTSDASCRMARVQLEGLLVREAGLQVLETDVELARQRLAVCEADVAAAVITAPDDGWVIERIVEPGGSAKVGEPMMSLWLGAPWVEAWVDEKKLAGIQIGSPVDVRLTAFPGRKLRGSVESIGVLADKELLGESVPSTLHSFLVRNAMVPIRIAVPEGQIRLQPGLTALVGIGHGKPSEPPRQALRGEGVLKSSSLVVSEPTAEVQNPPKLNKKPN